MTDSGRSGLYGARRDVSTWLAQSVCEAAPIEGIRDLVCEYLNQHGYAPVLWHPLGFIDVPIERNAAGKLVIHVWHPRFSRAQQPRQICHSHGWILHSAVLAGELENHTFDIAGNPAGEQRLYQVRYAGASSVSEALDERVTSTRAGEERLSAGRQYTLPADTFHWSQELGALAVTVMYANFVDATPAYVVRPWTGSHTYTYVRQACDASDQRHILADIKNAIRG